MLLSFSAKNFKSFSDGFEFSMIPASKQTGLDYSVLKETIGSKEYKALCSAIIYGPNAAGKTNIVGAMDAFKQIVLRGNILNGETNNYPAPDEAAYSLELIPFFADKEGRPVAFSISFIEQKMLVEYSFEMDLGAFLQDDYDRKILKETLSLNEKIIFQREGSRLKLSSTTAFKPYLNEFKKVKFEDAAALAEGGLNPTGLFLTNGFKNIISDKLSTFILSWIKNKFKVIYRSDSVLSIKKIKDPEEDALYEEEMLTRAAEIFGKGSETVGFVSKKDEDPLLCSAFRKGDKSVAIPAEVFESYGTYRFLNEFPIIITTLLTGGTLIVDEFDASLHPMALMNIINIFHNDDINVNHAQLIFNTHNPIFLNASLYRRDEIKFVERKDRNSPSVHYSLSDFKTNGEDPVRKGEDYMKNYFVSRYGAIKDVDFAPVIEKIVKRSEEVKK